MKVQVRRPVEIPEIPFGKGDLAPEKPTLAKKRTRHLGRWLVFLLIVAAASYSVWRWATAVPVVTVAPVEMTDLWVGFSSEGVVRGKDYVLSAESGGKVVQLLVQEGQSVRSGQVLLRLNADQAVGYVAEMEAAYRTSLQAVSQAHREVDLVRRRNRAAIEAAETRVRQAELQHAQLLSGARPEEIAQAQQRTARAAAILTEAEKAFKRAESLYESGAIARAMLEKAEAAYRAAQADLSSAQAAERLVKAGPSAEQIAVSKAALDSARAEASVARTSSGEIEVAEQVAKVAVSRSAQALAALERSRYSVREQTISAPQAGTVTKLNVEQGSVLLPGAMALTLSTREDLRVEAEISTEDTSKVKERMEVLVTSASYPGKSFRAAVTSIMPAGELKPDAAIRTRIVRARVRLLQGSELFRPGMEVDVEGRSHLGKLTTVPTDAIRFSGETPSVYLIENGRIVERPVKIGAQSADRTEIISGVQVGERIVLRGKDEVAPGEKARAVK